MKRSTALLFALVLILLMAGNGADFFFHRPYYEYWDTAANSLSVIRAKHFTEIYGQYSRWMFHHPGPVFFYVSALGEWLFYDTLHLVPAPYNGQELINLCLMVGFYVTTLRIFTLWLPRPQRGGFLFLALGAGILHFGSMSVNLPAYDLLRGSSAFLSNWSAHVLVLPLLCLLAAGASVAAGRGQDLPLLVLTGGFLVHGYVAQPLFVVPLSLLAYAGLLGYGVRCERNAASPPEEAAPVRRRRGVGLLGAAWRRHRGAHLGALALALLFALPLIIDVFGGANSNLAAILTHLRTHHSEHKTLVRSLLFFLQYGAYTAYRPNEMDFGHYDAPGAWAYVREHSLIFAVWLAAAALACGALVAPVGTLRRRAAVAADLETATAADDRRRFLAWAALFVAVAVALTLRWGHIMDGDMFYYNAVFNFGIYYFVALVAAAVVAGWPWLRWLTGGGGWQEQPRVRAAVAVALLALLGVVWADRFRVSDSAPETTRAMHEATARVLAATAPAPGETAPLAVFDFTSGNWPSLIGLALELRRAGRPFAVRDRWWVTFGEPSRLDKVPEDRLVNARAWNFKILPAFTGFHSAAGPLARLQALWLAELENAAAHPTPGAFQLMNGVALTVLPLPVLDPATPQDGNADVVFTPGGNSTAYTVAGWSGQEGFGAWSEQRRALMRFRPAPVTGEAVEMTLEALAFVVPERGLPSQRVRVFFNGESLGPEQRMDVHAYSRRVFTIPAARWNRAAGPSAPLVPLVFEFPDAATPDSFTNGAAKDGRFLALGFHTLSFRVVPAAPAPPVTPP